jgi:hypothetical protein
LILCQNLWLFIEFPFHILNCLSGFVQLLIVFSLSSISCLFINSIIHALLNFIDHLYHHAFEFFFWDFFSFTIFLVVTVEMVTYVGSSSFDFFFKYFYFYFEKFTYLKFTSLHIWGQVITWKCYLHVVWQLKCYQCLSKTMEWEGCILISQHCTEDNIVPKFWVTYSRHQDWPLAPMKWYITSRISFILVYWLCYM